MAPEQTPTLRSQEELSEAREVGALPLALAAAHRAEMRRAQSSALGTEDPASGEPILETLAPAAILGTCPAPSPLPVPLTRSESRNSRRGSTILREGLSLSTVTSDLAVDRAHTRRCRGHLA